MATGGFSQNVSKLFNKLKLVTDNLSLYVVANWEATEMYFVLIATVYNY